jgi:ribonuclease HI
MTAHDDVIAAEMRLLDPAVRASRPDLQLLLSEDFREFGSSGREWHRDAIIDALVSQPPAPPPTVDQVRVDELGQDVVLLTYRSTSDRSVTLRSSIWSRDGARWVLRFHQGTPAE